MLKSKLELKKGIEIVSKNFAKEKKRRRVIIKQKNEKLEIPIPNLIMSSI